MRVGVIGAGPRGTYLALILAGFPDVSLTAICDSAPAGKKYFLAEVRRQGLADMLDPVFYPDVDEFLERADMDVVLVASPAPLHAEHAIKSLTTGRHVISEVPAVYTMDEAQNLTRAVKNSFGKYFFAENCCYWNFVREWKKAVQAGRVGVPQYVEGEYIHGLADPSRKCDKLYWRTYLEPVRYSTHEIGPLLDVLDDRITEVIGFTTSNLVGCDKGRMADDIQAAFFRTARGVVYKQVNGFGVHRKHMGEENGFPVYHYYSLYGSKGFLETTRHGKFSTLAVLDGDKVQKTLDWPMYNPNLPPNLRGGHGTADWEMLDDFLRCIRDDLPPTIDVHRGLDFSLPGLLAVESIRQGCVKVAVPDSREFKK